MDTNDTQFSPGGDATAELTDNFDETARILFAAGRVSDTLREVVSLSVATIEGCDFAGLFLLDGVTVTTPVRTDPVVDLIDNFSMTRAKDPASTRSRSAPFSTPLTWTMNLAGPCLLLAPHRLVSEACWHCPSRGTTASVLSVSMPEAPSHSESSTGPKRLSWRHSPDWQSPLPSLMNKAA